MHLGDRNLPVNETDLNDSQLLLGMIIIGPWVAMVVYDLVLYLVRIITYEIPFVGGRARGRQRPRAPSLTERPSGRARTFKLDPRSQPSSINHQAHTEAHHKTGSHETDGVATRRNEVRPSEKG